MGWPLAFNGVREVEMSPAAAVAVAASGNVTDGAVPVASNVNVPDDGTGVDGMVNEALTGTDVSPS